MWPQDHTASLYVLTGLIELQSYFIIMIEIQMALLQLSEFGQV